MGSSRWGKGWDEDEFGGLGEQARPVCWSSSWLGEARCVWSPLQSGVHEASGAGPGCATHVAQNQLRPCMALAWQGPATVWAKLLDWLLVHCQPCRGRGAGNRSSLCSSSHSSAGFINQRMKGCNTLEAYIRVIAHWGYGELPVPLLGSCHTCPPILVSALSSFSHLRKSWVVCIFPRTVPSITSP